MCIPILFSHRRLRRSLLSLAVSALLLLPMALLVLPLPELHAAFIEKGLLEVELTTLFMGANGGDTRVPVILDQPIGETSDRLFVGSLLGQINIINNGPTTTYLDLSSETLVAGGTGMLGLAFHPGFNNPVDPGYRKVYTFHSVDTDPNAPVTFSVPGEVVTHHNLVTEWQVDADDPDAIDLSTRREVYREAHPRKSNHDGGMIDFGPDGYLYITTGAPPGLALLAQQNDNILGKLLRIDPLAPSATADSSDPVSVNGQYRVPASNPFVSDSNSIDEIYAFGFRNPYRMSVDPVTGVVFLGDVGEGLREEVGAVLPGENHGWPYWEGSAPGPTPLPNPPPIVTPPIADYVHINQGGDGRSVIGGFVYRGSIPDLQGKYVFGELNFGTGPIGQSPGRLFWIDPYDELGELKDPSEVEISEFRLSEDTCDMVASTPPFGTGCTFDITLYGFGVDQDGEIYVLGEEANLSRIYKITGAQLEIPSDFNGDGLVGGEDLLLWEKSYVGPRYDINGDGQVSGGDFLEWQRSYTTEPPEFVDSPANLDQQGLVDSDDIRIWEQSYAINDSADLDNDGDSDGFDFLELQREITPFDFADKNRDRLVDGYELELWNESFGYDGVVDADGDGIATGLDFLIWQREVSYVSPFIAQDAQTVPEPTGFALSVLAGLLLANCFFQRFQRRPVARNRFNWR